MLLGSAGYAPGMRVRERLLLSSVVSALLIVLAGCASTPAGELQEQLDGVSGVESVYLGSSRVQVTLDEGIAAADALATIEAVHDKVVAAGGDHGLVVVIRAGDRDFGGAAPWSVYSYARWTSGTLDGDAFAQEAAFFASFAGWASLTTTPAQILRVGMTVTRSADAATDDPADGATPAPTEAAHVVEVHLDQPYPNPNSQSDVGTLITELQTMWQASGGASGGVTIG